MPGPAARAFVVYNALRLGLFAACLGLAALAGLRSILLIAVALLVSGVLAYFLLDRQRRAMAEELAVRVERSRQRLAERTAREDAYVDALHAGDADVTRTDR
jgi:uncharacterized membrane protein